MKGSTILTILVATVTSFIGSVECEQNEDRVELLYPSGFRISLKDDSEFYKFRFHGNINENIKGNERLLPTFYDYKSPAA